LFWLPLLLPPPPLPTTYYLLPYYNDLRRFTTTLRLRAGNQWAWRKGREKKVSGNIKGVHWAMLALSLFKTREVREFANTHHRREIMNHFAGMVQGLGVEFFKHKRMLYTTVPPPK